MELGLCACPVAKWSFPGSVQGRKWSSFTVTEFAVQFSNQTMHKLSRMVDFWDHDLALERLIGDQCQIDMWNSS